MFKRTPRDERHQLDETIDHLINELKEQGIEDQAKTVEAIKTLMELRQAERNARRVAMSPEVLITAAAHILGIAMILGFEKANVITSKSLSFVPKIRP